MTKGFLFWIVLLQSFRGAYCLFDSFFGIGGSTAGPCESAGNSEDKLACQIDLIYQRVALADGSNGDQGQSSYSRSNDIEQGKRALDCVAAIAGLDLEQQFGRIRVAKNLVMDLVHENYFASLNRDDERVDRICQVSERRLNLKKQLLQSQASSSSQNTDPGSHRLRRRLGDPAVPIYPAKVSVPYQVWVDRYVSTYLQPSRSGDSTTREKDTEERADLDQVTTLILDPLIEVRQNSVDSGLSVARDVVEIICSILGSVELGFDPGDACRIISTSIQLSITVNDVAMTSLENELSEVNIHNVLIDSAEIEAAHENTRTLVRDLTR
ncbi:expressed unknown protein [Seminavis robusta]|uniref:Uncharacterized protein n=1 Tax=Seminavis robusta TaxID=568900 RepID=A0A9N8EE80_9STRA|nr:expressed unknown protein [Seminavis robusta]|eukprot:Sro871_g213750.1 n/a (325) ;mRNA; f:5306-6280